VNKSDLLLFLEKIGASPLKSLSQNFLIDKNIIQKFVALASIQHADQVLEIGSGPGAITEELLHVGANVVAVEKDRLFSQHLPPHPNLKIISADILKFPFESLGSGRWKVVSNIPFHITAPIFERLFAQIDLFYSFTLIVQKEVVDRIKAKPSTKQYGSLTIFLQFYTEIVSIFPVAASCFYPKPSVDSAAIHLIPRKIKPTVNPEHFFKILHKAFQQRRKMLSSSLKEIHPKIQNCLTELKLNPKARPEELSFEDWISFIETIDSTSL
jgi:16S rRNA (adenine1518-N6/adenine1519-N6)-dimethyltransferase